MLQKRRRLGTTSHFLSEFVAAAANGEKLSPTVVESKKVVSQDEKVIEVIDTPASVCRVAICQTRSHPS